MFGINGAELLVLVVLALVVVGPERLPSYAEQLGRWVRSLRRFSSEAKERLASEMGEDAADVDWSQLDPRRYDPRRIVREALLEDAEPVRPVVGAGPGRRYTSGQARAAGAAAAAVASTPGEPAVDGPAAPFDDEAT